MAKASLSIYFDALQGRIGKATFTKTKQGTIVRESVDGVQPNTLKQQAVTGRFTLTATFWDALTDAQQEAWKTWALTQHRVDPVTKVSYKPTGYNCYSKLANVWLGAHGNAGTPPVAPPTGDYSGDAITITASALAGSVSFIGSGPTSANTVVEFWLQPLKRASRTPAKKGYRVVGYASLTTQNDNQFVVSMPPGVYAAQYCFVDKTTGQRTAFRAIPVSGVALALEQGGAEEAPAAKPTARKKAA